MLDCVSATVQALAAVGDLSAARESLDAIESPSQRERVAASAAHALATADAAAEAQDDGIRAAARWSLLHVLAGDHWYEALGLVAAQEPDALTAAFAVLPEAPPAPAE